MYISPVVNLPCGNFCRKNGVTPVFISLPVYSKHIKDHVVRQNAVAKLLEPEKLKVEAMKNIFKTIIASILGVAFDDLRNRRRRQRLQLAGAAGTVVFAAALAFLGYALSRVRIISAQVATM